MCICMGPIHLYGGKMLIISNDFSSEACGPMLLKFHVEPSFGQGKERMLKWSWSIDQDGCHAHV